MTEMQNDSIAEPECREEASSQQPEESAEPEHPLKSDLEAIASSLKQLQADFDTKLKYDQSKDKVIDALHEELQELRSDQVFRILRPFANDVLQLYFDIDSVTSRKVDETSDPNQVIEQMRGFMDDIRSLLDRYGFEMFHSDDNVYDRTLHRVARVEPTDDVDLDVTIAERVRSGLRYEGRILQPESVVVYQASGKTEKQSS